MAHSHMHGDDKPQWLNQPVMFHSSREDECTLTPEQCEYRGYFWRYWYEADHAYALSTVYFFVTTIGTCMLAFGLLRLAPEGLRRTPWWRKLVSAIRHLSYRRYEIVALRWSTPSLGVGILLLIGGLFFLLFTLVPQPYYWPNTRDVSFGSSPPLATRTGYMALGCLPFLIILPTKANMIASITGVSHERLIVFHNWISWAMFVLALIHTFPFIIFHIWKGDMVRSWNTTIWYWSGSVALVLQAYLNVMSLPWIRNKYYEFFKSTHYIASLLFVIFFFLHCNFRLTSWDYFVAAAVLYTLSFLYSQVRTYFEHGLSNRATFTLVSESALRITIPLDTTWQPGQHVFLRFLTLGLNSFTTHPFTVCSTPSLKGGRSKSKLVFYVQPRGGMTARLASTARKNPGLSVPVHLDGPYGGVKGRPLSTYDRALVIACGAGAGFSLAFVMDWCLRGAHQSQVQVPGSRRLKVVIATRDQQLVEWYREALEVFMEENGIEFLPEGLTIVVHLTSASHVVSETAPQDSSQDEAEKPTADGTAQRGSTVGLAAIQNQRGRPDLRGIVRTVTMEDGVSVGIAVCGPRGVLKDTQDEAAAAQLRILKSRGGATDVYLHSEVFS